MSPPVNPVFLKQWNKVLELDATAHEWWAKKDKAIRKLVRIGKLGKRRQKLIPISEEKAVKLTNQFVGKDKVFTPAFARRYEAEEVKRNSR